MIRVNDKARLQALKHDFQQIWDNHKAPAYIEGEGDGWSLLSTTSHDSHIMRDIKYRRILVAIAFEIMNKLPPFLFASLFCHEGCLAIVSRGHSMADMKILSRLC